jgi:hypothetical protein
MSVFQIFVLLSSAAIFSASIFLLLFAIFGRRKS